MRIRRPTRWFAGSACLAVVAPVTERGDVMDVVSKDVWHNRGTLAPLAKALLSALPVISFDLALEAAHQKAGHGEYDDIVAPHGDG